MFAYSRAPDFTSIRFRRGSFLAVFFHGGFTKAAICFRWSAIHSSLAILFLTTEGHQKATLRAKQNHIRKAWLKTSTMEPEPKFQAPAPQRFIPLNTKNHCNISATR